ncbi:MAG: cupin domain-containing protein [Bacteroidetes bacterium]|nr:cupin domain-containing protein [Bacteroidota bacterium]MBP7399996.1 cupin domain-containing protein [Chitinophagales bacterium]MBK7108787.1 cupin domain-containing protein [Bacteroidota bacterium]MBK8488886.1 cupin domain-containing protein [Bacteroidota bacterium]MBK8680738.1 cupin domain-containing protein [Bacteroidota bacterium]
METKRNESTELRPEGDRVIDAPLVNINIPEFIKQLKSEDTWKSSDRNAITVFKTNGLRIVLIALRAEAEMPKHNADGIISVQVIEGEIKFTTDAKSLTLLQGEMLALHKGLHHSVKAIKESVIILTLTTTLEE